MRRLRWIVALLVGLALPAAACAWEIASFKTRVELHEDATATITETIVADFTGESRRGIFRDIPIHYTDRAGGHFRLRLRVRDITDERGQPRRYRLEPAGRYQRIRIGDPDVLVTGRQAYRIVYDVQRGAVRFFPDHDECYWNLTGNEWVVPMRRVSAEVRLPRGASNLRAIAYVGGYGSRTQLAPLDLRADQVVWELPGGFGSYEGLTAAVAWEKGIVRPSSAVQVLGWWLEDNWVYGLPVAVCLIMYWLWSARGRDPRPGRSQVVEYQPPEDLTPAEAGTLLDQRVNLRDITSTVIDLAVRGYLRIEPQEGTSFGRRVVADYRLVRLKPKDRDAELKWHERYVLEGIFGLAQTSRILSNLEEEFYVKLPAIRDALYDGLVKAGHFDSHPDRVRTGYLLLGFVAGGLLWMALLASRSWHQIAGAGPAIASLLSTLIVSVFSLVMPRRTLKGALATDRAFGFLEFVRRADQDRLRRINDPGLFERGLPYAMAFGVADHWARAFEGIYTTPPSWYGGRWDTFSPHQLGRELDHASASMGRTFTSQPRSSGSSSSWGGSGGGGGGFSGGGGGGGGGGAW